MKINNSFKLDITKPIKKFIINTDPESIVQNIKYKRDSVSGSEKLVDGISEKLLIDITENEGKSVHVVKDSSLINKNILILKIQDDDSIYFYKIYEDTKEVFTFPFIYIEQENSKILIKDVTETTYKNIISFLQKVDNASIIKGLFVKVNNDYIDFYKLMV